MNDAYHWIVEYLDGSTIAQIDPDGNDVGSWRKVDVRNVNKIVLVPNSQDLPIHGISVPEGAIAFFTFRRTQELNPNTGEQFSHPSLVVAGWEKDGHGCYMHVDQFGNSLMSDIRDRTPE